MYNITDQPWDISRLSVRMTKTVFDSVSGVPIFVIDPEADDESQNETMGEKLFKTFF